MSNSPETSNMKKYIFTAFTLAQHSNAFLQFHTKTFQPNLYAEGGAPQYEKFDGILKNAEILSKGNVMLHLETDQTLDYEPGHVLALEIENERDFLDENSKVAKDAKSNDGWMRGPYTVSRSTSNSMDILIKVVGEKSKRFASAKSGTPIKFGGKFKVPILKGIRGDTQKVVLISTGSGVGPCVGAIELALKDSTHPEILLLSSFRKSDEVVYKEHLDKLHEEHSGKFSWKSIITSEEGRLSSSEDNLKNIVSGSDTHYHLIGNGQMVKEFSAGLSKAGVPDDKITVEFYFNHKAEIDEEVIDRIAKVVSSSKVDEKCVA